MQVKKIGFKCLNLQMINDRDDNPATGNRVKLFVAFTELNVLIPGHQSPDVYFVKVVQHHCVQCYIRQYDVVVES